MASFISRLLGKSNDAVPRELAGLRPLEPGTREKSGRREPPTELDWSHAEYIPLPPSPPTWEVDGRDKFHAEFNNPAIKPVYQAAFQHQHAKVVRLAAGLSAEHRQGGIGKEIAKAYRKLIIQGTKAGQLAAAAKRCIEMFEMVPGEVQDVDRRRFNRVLNQLDKAGKRHSYTPTVVTSVPHPNRCSRLRTALDGISSKNGNCRRTRNRTRPSVSFRLADRGLGCLTVRGRASASRK